MKYFVQEMTNAYARKVLSWRYEPPYDLYNQEEYAEGLTELMNGSYLIITDSFHQLIGFYCTGISAQVPKGHEFSVYDEPYLDFGLGLRPDLTGLGNGQDFFGFILQHIYGNNLRLTVASFNERAIRLYKNFGFDQVSTFSNGQIEFMTMVKKVR